jgi:hypothetical protein
MTMRKNIPPDLHLAAEWIASQKSKVCWKIATDKSFRFDAISDFPTRCRGAERYQP